MRRRVFSDMVSLLSVSLFLAVVVVMAYKSTLYLGVCVERDEVRTRSRADIELWPGLGGRSANAGTGSNKVRCNKQSTM